MPSLMHPKTGSISKRPSGGGVLAAHAKVCIRTIVISMLEATIEEPVVALTRRSGLLLSAGLRILRYSSVIDPTHSASQTTKHANTNGAEYTKRAALVRAAAVGPLRGSVAARPKTL
jgi:hypothetical protein